VGSFRVDSGRAFLGDLAGNYRHWIDRMPRICTVTTLDHHAAALLACGVFGVAGLAGLIPTTRGFSRCNGPEVIGLTTATATSGASLLGIAALITGALILLIILATFILASTASRRETDHARTRPPYPIALAEVAGRSRTR
jgi:hypothetical protein